MVTPEQTEAVQQAAKILIKEIRVAEAFAHINGQELTVEHVLVYLEAISTDASAASRFLRYELLGEDGPAVSGVEAT